MSKELNKTTEEIMSKIKNGQIKMRPRLYFIFDYVFTIVGLVFSFVTSIFFVGLTRFNLRNHGPMGEYRLEQLVSTFSWWMPILAILGLIAGIYLLRKYNFFYKINFKLVIIGLITSILISGFLIDLIGLNDFWINKAKYRGRFYKQEQYNKVNNITIFNNK
jgi:uncharacterized membrane protein YdcZ (DUF606 family)